MSSRRLVHGNGPRTAASSCAPGVRRLRHAFALGLGPASPLAVSFLVEVSPTVSGRVLRHRLREGFTPAICERDGVAVCPVETSTTFAGAQPSNVPGRGPTFAGVGTASLSDDRVWSRGAGYDPRGVCPPTLSPACPFVRPGRPPRSVYSGPGALPIDAGSSRGRPHHTPRAMRSGQSRFAGWP